MDRSVVIHRILPGVSLLAVLWFVPAASQAQFVDEHFSPLAAAPEPGTAAPAVSQPIDEGYSLLARATGPEDEATLDAAKAAFDRALDVESRNIYAWNGMGMYELAKDEGWLILLESFKKLFNRDHISMSIKAFERALDTDPAFHPARYNLALAYRQARGEENWRKAVRELERLMREAPATGQTPLLLALTYRDLGELDAMRKALEAAPGSAGLPGSVRGLLLAWSMFNTGDATGGSAAYWQGVDAIGSDHEARLFWHDIRPVATPAEDAAFDGLSVAEKTEFLRQFWQKLADQAFVPVDNRLSEHYRRLDHVYRNFRIDLPERRHYSTIAAYVPPWQTGFDDRGVIYLRHGSPDDEATYSGPEVERNLSWKYDRAGGDPVVFHFVSDEDVADFKLVKQLSDAVIQNSTGMAGETLLAGSAICTSGGRCGGLDRATLRNQARSLQSLYSSRGHLDPLYDRASMRLDIQILDEERAMLAENIEIATHSRTFRPPDGETLRYPIQAVPFKNPDGQIAVAFYYALPAAQIDVISVEGGRSAVDYRQQILVEPLEGGEPMRSEEEGRLVAAAIPRQEGVYLPRVRWMDLAPGRYQYGLRLTDLNSGRSGLAQGAVSIDALSSGGLALSGIVLATGVTPAANPADPFVRWGRWRVVPLPSHMYRRAQPVFVYYEAYGLAQDASGAARYKTTYTLEAGNPDRNVVARFISGVGERLFGGEEKGSISYSFEHSRTEDVDPTLEFFSLDVSGSPAGDYVLTIEVEDLVAGQTRRRQARLTLVE